MIDLHSHILPGIDDGAKDLQSALDMAQQALGVGVDKMVCTPHIHMGYFDNNIQIIKTVYQTLLMALKKTECELKIAFAAEVRICPEIIQWVKTNDIPYIGQWQGRKAMLLELPHSHIPPGSDKLIRWLMSNHIQPIIVHPERNRDIIANFKRIYPLKRAGAIFQVTAGSITGRFSPSIRDIAFKMLDEELISFVASDTHNTDRRPNDMGLCRDVLLDRVGEPLSSQLLFDTPKKITEHLQWS
ncbi:histidinol-phosphatase [Aliiglaciecola sp. 2_MG-2023]|uniref:tyrosine-protein phosphatase n=1 Tax=unclassified Aliiglaciecola TaxID=2593648 RepID=UPI0026E20B26|nr:MULTISPECIES: CpsB/CapC family capsule biosynthesis tyrosine phosphatase [unclassified Aliiglaciecola]MDO6712192.1 histidinol-phosphatase [Aliiglaciecola sp. 2_MG-2023]MDO6753570.1 histidinol-phosphatase [Aliiglaciecola sp. 1_MG-2023]